MNIFYFPGSSAFILLLCLGIDLMSGPLPEYISRRGFCICGLRQGGFVELPGLVSYFVYLRLCTFGIFSFSVLWSMWITCVEKKNTAWLSLNWCWMIVQYLVMNWLEFLRWRNPDEIAKLVLNFNFSKFPNSRHPLYTDSSQSFISCPGRAKPNPSRCLICPKEIEQNRKPTPPLFAPFFFFLLLCSTHYGAPEL